MERNARKARHEATQTVGLELEAAVGLELEAADSVQARDPGRGRHAAAGSRVRKAAAAEGLQPLAALGSVVVASLFEHGLVPCSCSYWY